MSNVDINVDRRTDRRMDGLMDGWMDGQKIGCLYRTLLQAGAIKMNKCIRRGITAFKFVIWGGKLVVLRWQITFYGSADASP